MQLRGGHNLACHVGWIRVFHRHTQAVARRRTGVVMPKSQRSVRPRARFRPSYTISAEKVAGDDACNEWGGLRRCHPTIRIASLAHVKQFSCKMDRHEPREEKRCVALRDSPHR
jgi:hypothetical protein